MDEKVMTPEEFLNKMKQIYSGNWDEETAHADADDLMIELLCQLGYGDGANFFDKQPKWYS